MKSIPRPYLTIYIGLSAVLNILGIASLIDSFVIWAGFAAKIVETYQDYLRWPLLCTLTYFWPSSWPKFPRAVADILIIQASFFISYRLFMAFETNRFDNVFKELRIPTYGAALFLTGPLIPIFQLWRLATKVKYELQMARKEAAAAKSAERQFRRYGHSNELTLTEEGWKALDKRQIAAMQADEAARTTFKKLTLYYFCYVALVVLILFVAFQVGRITS